MQMIFEIVYTVQPVYSNFQCVWSFLLLFCFVLRVKLSLFPRIFRLNPLTSQASIQLIVEIMKTECCVFVCVEIIQISGVSMCVWKS